jgi:hemoglobin
MSQRDQLGTEDDVRQFVYQFYDRVRDDPQLGPIFNAHVHDWDTHLNRMVQFWSSLMLGAGTYNGTPMPKHVALPGLSAELFGHWLDLFHETLAAQPNQQLAQQAEAFAQRIARSLWYGYQLHNQPNAPLTEVQHG